LAAPGAPLGRHHGRRAALPPRPLTHLSRAVPVAPTRSPGTSSSSGAPISWPRCV
jgi:hypothetical protein